MLATIALLALAQGEIPGFLIVNQVDIGDTTYKVGDAIKAGKKPRKMTGQKLVGELDLVRSIAPVLSDLAFNFTETVLPHCLDQCIVDQTTHKVDGVDVRLLGVGPTKDTLQIRVIIVDHKRAAMRYFHNESLRDTLAPYRRFYLTQKGLYRVSRHGATLRFEPR